VSSNPPMIQDFPADAGWPPADPPGPASGPTEPADTGPVNTGTDTPPPIDTGPIDTELMPADPEQPDPVALAAIDLAREAALELAEPGTVGDHLGALAEPGGLTVHAFESTSRGYRGWNWAVSLAHVPGSDRVTVCDVVLLPGAGAILAPVWIPWSDRLAPGDLGPGDELPYQPDDPLLLPGYTVTDEDDADQQMFWELGLRRERVIGPEGLTEAAQRWERGPHGPTSETAIQASAPCVTCGYFVSVSGPLRQHFGICTNEWSPADGSVVTMDFGCGAHSETDLELPALEPLAPHILDETIIEEVVVDRSKADGAPPVALEGETPAPAEIPEGDGAPPVAPEDETPAPAEIADADAVPPTP
jgi:hypothetical protein